MSFRNLDIDREDQSATWSFAVRQETVDVVRLLSLSCSPLLFFETPQRNNNEGADPHSSCVRACVRAWSRSISSELYG